MAVCLRFVFVLLLSDRQQIYIGDDNALTLKISAENQGEGAYEAELHIYLPQQADFTGVGRGEVMHLVTSSSTAAVDWTELFPSNRLTLAPLVLVLFRLSADCPAPTRRRTRPRWWCATWETP